MIKAFSRYACPTLSGLSSLKSITTQLNICEILEPRQWERLQHYARRVKTVVQMKGDLHDCVWSTLQDQYPGEHIFPNLRQLFTQCKNALVYLGKAPMLEVISFNMWPATYPAQSELPALSPKGFSESEMLSCILSNSRLSPGLGLDAVIFSCRHLTELNIPSLLQSKTLVHLSKLPILTHLGFDLGEENYDSFLCPGYNCLSSFEIPSDPCSRFLSTHQLALFRRSPFPYYTLDLHLKIVH